MASRVGFVGLGTMGQNLVRRLLATDHEVVAYDIDAERTETVVQDGAAPARDVGELVAAVDVVCTSLPDPASVRDVYLGSDGIVASAQPGTATIDFSTVDPFTSRENAGRGYERGLHVFDCPVSGGPREAAAGQLVVFVGGDEASVGRIQSILDAVGRLVHFIGPSGAGATVKMINNVIANGTVLLTAEAFVLGVKLGIDADTLFDVLMTAGARSHHFEKRFPWALADNFEAAYKLDLAKKDMTLALDVGREIAVPLSVTACIHELYAAGSALGFGDEDYVAIIKYFEQLAGVEARGRRRRGGAPISSSD